MLTPVKIYAGLAIAALIAAAGLGGYGYVTHLQHAAARAQGVAATQTGVATVATGQTAATADASSIADRGARRDELTITLHEDHAHALQSTPGADAPLPAGLNLAGRRGLCGYAAYAADPGCVGLRGDDPAQLPPAGGGDPAPVPVR